MIDLSPDPRDSDRDNADSLSAPRHDPVGVPPEKGLLPTIWPFPAEKAEAIISFVSRWSGPTVLAAVVIGLGWAIFARPR
ncbi:hypothetical protein [Sphingobium ummariense]